MPARRPMTFIVEHLHWCCVHGSQEDAIAAMTEAAAEIERLRAALKDIAGDDYLPDGIRAIEIARRALEQKP